MGPSHPVSDVRGSFVCGAIARSLALGPESPSREIIIADNSWTDGRRAVVAEIGRSTATAVLSSPAEAFAGARRRGRPWAEFQFMEHVAMMGERLMSACLRSRCERVRPGPGSVFRSGRTPRASA